MKALEDFTIGQLLAALSAAEQDFIDTCWPDQYKYVVELQATIKEAMQYEAFNLRRMEDTQ